MTGVQTCALPILYFTQFHHIVMEKIAFGRDDQRLIFAGPTCGKTTLLKQVVEGLVLDTDYIVSHLYRSWFEESLFKQYEKNAMFARNMELGSGFIAGLLLKVEPELLLLTNMSNKSFAEGLKEAGFDSSESPIFFRHDPQEMIDLDVKRGGDLTLPIAKRWVDGLEKFAKKGGNVQWLENGEFLSDHVKVIDATPTKIGNIIVTEFQKNSFFSTK